VGRSDRRKQRQFDARIEDRGNSEDCREAKPRMSQARCDYARPDKFYLQARWTSKNKSMLLVLSGALRPSRTAIRFNPFICS
jgi:hypothetical protein